MMQTYRWACRQGKQNSERCRITSKTNLAHDTAGKSAILSFWSITAMMPSISGLLTKEGNTAHQTTKSESGTLAHSVVSAHDEEVDASSSSSYSSSQRTKRRGQGPSTDAMPPTRSGRSWRTLSLSSFISASSISSSCFATTFFLCSSSSFRAKVFWRRNFRTGVHCFGCSVRKQRCGEERPRGRNVTDRDCSPAARTPPQEPPAASQLHWRSSVPMGLRSDHLAPHHSCDAAPPPVPSARSSARVARTSGAGGPCAAEQRLQRVQPWAARLTSKQQATREKATLVCKCLVVVAGWLWGGCGVVVVVVVVVRTGCSARMSVHTRTRMHLIEMNQCQCTGSFGWTDQPEYPYACSL